MVFNKDIFAMHFKKNDYEFCCEMLRNEIITILVNKIKLKKKDYKYSTISFLKSDCYKYLSSIYYDIALTLYTFSFNDDSTEYELSRMMEMYQYLITENA